jgi:hypothetical protein
MLKTKINEKHVKIMPFKQTKPMHERLKKTCLNNRHTSFSERQKYQNPIFNGKIYGFL